MRKNSAMVKTVTDTLAGFFLGEGQFSNFGIKRMYLDYLWRGLDYRQTVNKKLKLHSEWKALEKKSKEVKDAGREALAVIVVKEWGGIGNNSAEKLAQFCDQIDIEEIEIPLSGIASRSKILPIAYPEKFIIMDARVVISLAVVQLIEQPAEGTLFPYMESRNKILTRANPSGFLAKPQYRRDAIIKKNPGWRKVDRRSAYAEYLLLLRDVSEVLVRKGFNHKIWDLEMTLFSQVVGLVSQLDRTSVQTAVAASEV